MKALRILTTCVTILASFNKCPFQYSNVFQLNMQFNETVNDSDSVNGISIIIWYVSVRKIVMLWWEWNICIRDVYTRDVTWWKIYTSIYYQCLKYFPDNSKLNNFLSSTNSVIFKRNLSLYIILKTTVKIVNCIQQFNSVIFNSKLVCYDSLKMCMKKSTTQRWDAAFFFETLTYGTPYIPLLFSSKSDWAW